MSQGFNSPTEGHIAELRESAFLRPRGVVVNMSACRAEDHGFDTRRGRQWLPEFHWLQHLRDWCSLATRHLAKVKTVGPNPTSRSIAALAQLAEHVIGNDEVLSSSLKGGPKCQCGENGDFTRNY